jgi:hypothetical protein
VTRLIAADCTTLVDSSRTKTLLDLRHRASERESVGRGGLRLGTVALGRPVTGVDGLLPAGGCAYSPAAAAVWISLVVERPSTRGTSTT